MTVLLPRATVRSASSPQEGTFSGDAVVCCGVSTYASGCSRQLSGCGSQCCAVQWYYGDIASCIRPKTRIQRNRSRGLVLDLPSFRCSIPGLPSSLETIAPIQEQRMLLAVTFTLPASCSPTACAKCSNSIEQDAVCDLKLKYEAFNLSKSVKIRV
jgi:hypothetical protein